MGGRYGSLRDVPAKPHIGVAVVELDDVFHAAFAEAHAPGAAVAVLGTGPVPIF